MQNDPMTEYILPEDKIRLIKDSLNADAILSLDRLSVIPSIHLTQVDEALFFGDLDIAVYADLKLYMGEKEVRDSAGHPITIQKYQIPEYGADIREV